MQGIAANMLGGYGRCPCSPYIYTMRRLPGSGELKNISLYALMNALFLHKPYRRSDVQIL
jgi:hypothetical protein